MVIGVFWLKSIWKFIMTIFNYENLKNMDQQKWIVLIEILSRFLRGVQKHDPVCIMFHEANPSVVDICNKQSAIFYSSREGNLAYQFCNNYY